MRLVRGGGDPVPIGDGDGGSGGGGGGVSCILCSVNSDCGSTVCVMNKVGCTSAVKYCL